MVSAQTGAAYASRVLARILLPDARSFGFGVQGEHMKINGHTFVHAEEDAPDPGTLSDKERLVIAMAELAKVNRELREVRRARNEFAMVLQADIERLESEKATEIQKYIALHEAKRLKQVTIDGLRADLEGNKVKRQVQMANTIDESIADASPDELELIQRFTTKLMSEGRRQYGRLDLASDKRAPEDFREEALDEGCDAVAYLLMAMMAVER
jgi:hypothetical protein